jgi:CRISPR-associated protein Csd1
MKTDPLLTNTAYRLGRLFAAFEKIEIEANPGVQPTVRRINYGMALSRPGTIFPDLTKTAKDQLLKIGNAELRDKLWKLLAYLWEDLDSVPLYLSTSEHHMFMSGYDKQVQDFIDGIFE